MALNLQQLHPQDATYGQTQFTQQGAALPAIASLLGSAANADNSSYQAGIFGVDPNLKSNIGSVDELARVYGLGGVSDDTRGAINRSTAFNALQGGFRGPDATAATGPVNSAQTAANAVSVGKTALNEQAQAPGLAAQAEQASLALNPTHVDVGSTLISPAAILARQDAADSYNNDLVNQSRIINAGSAAQSNTQGVNAIFGGIGGLLKGMGGLSGLFGGG